jgi:antagonist of KipI
LSIRITEAGIMDTIQDNGRHGYGAMGINPGGAMDIVAAHIANFLAGNDEHEAVIEMHYPAPVLYFDAPAIIAITGGDFLPCINGLPVPLNTPVIITAGSELRFNKLQKGSRCYLAVNGGFRIGKWLDSYSTNLKARAGGALGRQLQKGDILETNICPGPPAEQGLLPLSFGNRRQEIRERQDIITDMRTEGLGVRSIKDNQPPHPLIQDPLKNIEQKNERIKSPLSPGEGLRVRFLPWHADVSSFYKNDAIIRITKGHEYDQLSECSGTIIGGNTFSISTQSDRMGYRMNGSPLKLNTPIEMISSAVTRGTIQLLPNGQLIILMADHQTTGGYPRLAHVISADLPSLAQAQPNSSIRFQLVSLEEAESLFLQQHHNLQQVKSACHFRLHQSPAT